MGRKGGGRVRDRTKITTWKAYEAAFRDAGLLDQEDQDGRGLWPIPGSKRGAYESMRRLEDGSGWELEYYFTN